VVMPCHNGGLQLPGFVAQCNMSVTETVQFQGLITFAVTTSEPLCSGSPSLPFCNTNLTEQEAASTTVYRRLPALQCSAAGQMYECNGVTWIAAPVGMDSYRESACYKTRCIDTRH
jgi:hypothetical protein